MIIEVEKFILDEIELIYGKILREIIDNLPIEDRRIAMFGAISLKKDGEHKQMIETLRKNDNSVILNQIEKIIERFRKYLPVGDVEKKSFGEVFTNFSLVNEMLDTLPVDVWSNPTLKWGDFCNGIGNFMVVVAKRLMIGLESWEPNENKRYKHIMENMIYVAELQIKNMFLWMVSMDPKSKLKLNLYRGDSLSKEFDQHMKDVWKVDKFDVLVSNVPYQKQEEGNKKTQAIWHFFVEKYMSILSDGGYMVMVHPSLWRNPDGIYKNVQKLLRSKNMIYLEIHDLNDGVKNFSAQTSYDFYCIKNSTNKNFITNIKTLDGNIECVNISDMEFIPSRSFDIFAKIIANKNEEKVKLIYSRTMYGNDKPHMSKEKSIFNIYPCVYTITKKSINLWWSKEKKDHFGVPKVIWSNGSATTPIIDINGEYGIMNFACGIADNVDILEKIQNAMMNKNFIKLMNFSEGDRNVIGHKYNNKIIALLKKDFWKEFI